MSAYRHSSGIIRHRASMRGRTRNSIGGMPKVTSASTSSVTFIVPSWAANAAPVRPAMMMPVIIAPISRSMAIPTRLAMKMSAPNCCSCTAPTKARIRPTRMLISVTMGRASAPASCRWSRRSLCLKRARKVNSRPDGERHLAEEGQELEPPGCAALRPGADAREQPSGAHGGFGLALGDGLGELEQAPHAGRQSSAVDFHRGRLAAQLEIREEGEQRAVPALELGCIEAHAPDLLRGELALELLRRRPQCPQAPFARQAHDEPAVSVRVGDLCGHGRRSIPIGRRTKRGEAADNPSALREGPPFHADPRTSPLGRARACCCPAYPRATWPTSASAPRRSAGPAHVPPRRRGPFVWT